MEIANEHVELQPSSSQLPMVHRQALWSNVNEAWVEGKPRYRTHRQTRFSNIRSNEQDVATYNRGGFVVNVVLVDDFDTHQDWRIIMICDAETCFECFPQSAIPGPGTTRGLPFVHASSLHRAPPPNTMAIDPGVLFFREKDPLTPRDMVPVYCQKKLVNYEAPIGGGGIITIATAVCIPERCELCGDMVEQISPSPPNSDVVDHSPRADSDVDMTDEWESGNEGNGEGEETEEEDTEEEDTEMREENTDVEVDNTDVEEDEEEETKTDGDQEEEEVFNRPAPTGPNNDLYFPRSLCDSRLGRGTRRFKYLVWWQGFPEDEATWEPISTVIMTDPKFISNFHKDWPESDRPTEAEAAEYGIEHLLNRSAL